MEFFSNLFIINKQYNCWGKYYDTKTQVMISDDGINWKVVDEILQSDTGNGHMTFPHVVSFREEEDVYALYVHEDFMTVHNKLARYTIDKGELDSYVIW